MDNLKQHTNWFENEYCLTEFDDKKLYVPVCFTFGYLLYDLFLIYFKMHDSSDAGMQVYLHHILGISGCFVLMGYG